MHFARLHGFHFAPLLPESAEFSHFCIEAVQEDG